MFIEALERKLTEKAFQDESVERILDILLTKLYNFIKLLESFKLHKYKLFFSVTAHKAVSC